jgi:hypothetical protein
VLSSPGDYATGIGSSVTLVWQCAPDAVSFNLDVDDEPSFAAPRVASVVGIAGTSRAVPNLLPGRSYYWRVTGVSPNGTGTPSPSQRFTTAPVPPAPYLSGSAATVGTSQHPMLSWQPVSGAVFTLYRYRCDESAECGDASPRETVYNGTGTSWIDTRTKIGKKYSSSRAYYYLVATVLGFTSAPSNQVSYAVDGTIVYSAGRSGDEPGPGEGPRSADGPDGAGVRPAIPEVHRLGDNYPNPFNPSTRIPFDIAEGGGHVRICVYSSDGREVGVIADGAYSPGFHEVRWDGASLGAGVYFIQMTLIPTDGPGVFREMKKALLLK